VAEAEQNLHDQIAPILQPTRDAGSVESLNGASTGAVNAAAYAFISANTVATAAAKAPRQSAKIVIMGVLRRRARAGRATVNAQA
jgi:hypothetical protein